MRYNKGIHDRKDGDEMDHCSSCGSLIEEGAKFCPDCGVRQVYCASCGAHLRAGSHFCSMCGAMVLASESEASCDAVVEEASVVTVVDAVRASADASDDVQAEQAAEPSVAADDTQKIVLVPPAEMVREEYYDGEEPKKSWFQANRRPLVLGAIFVIIVAVLSSWFFSSQMREDEYQAKMTTLCEDLTSIHTEVLRQTDMLDNANRGQIGQQIEKRLEVVRKLKEEQSDLRAPSSLKDENEKIAKILVLEEQLLSQMEVFCREPLATDPMSARQMLGEWVKKQDELCRTLELDARFADVPSLSRAVAPIYAMMEKEKKLEEERLKQLAMRKTFLEKMDGIIKDYDGQKGAMSAVLEEARSGAISSSTYRVHVAQARAAREALRSRVHALEVPNDAQSLVTHLDDVFAKSLYYCDLMDELANPLHSILQGRDIYGEARAVDGQVQDAYSAFISEYEAYKSAAADPKSSAEIEDKKEDKKSE